MFEVLAFVFDNYWRGDACPELPTLHRKLRDVGFDDEEIVNALVWLEDLKNATRHLPAPICRADKLPNPGLSTDDVPTGPPAMRIFTIAEQNRLGCQGWGFLLFLVAAGALARERLEVVMERVMATPDDELALDELKLIILMVFWSLDEEPDALVFDELCDNHVARQGH
jgi:Smg protein